MALKWLMNDIQFQQHIPSPCVRQCTLDQNDICLGCHRHIDEITSWHNASDQQKQAILDNASARKAEANAV